MFYLLFARTQMFFSITILALIFLRALELELLLFRPLILTHCLNVEYASATAVPNSMRSFLQV